MRIPAFETARASPAPAGGTAAFSQGRPLIAVLPLQALGELNAEQVGTVTRLLETGLVKSSVFQVLERSEIAQVLAAQEYSAEECFDESCAVRLGRLLAARLIVLGTLSRLGDKFFLTAKIIEVATGKTLEAEHEEADTLEAIARRAENLGFRLAGRQSRSKVAGVAGPRPRRRARFPSGPIPRKQQLQEEQRRLEAALAREIRRARGLRTGSRVLYGIAAGLALASGATLIVGLSQPAGGLRRALVRLQPELRGPRRRRGGGRHGSLAGTAGSGKPAGADRRTGESNP